MALLKSGDKVRDVYTVETLIGEGTFSEVYRVKHHYLGRQALKLFKTPCASQEEVRLRLEEASLLSHLGHPNIIRVFDANILILNGQSHGYFTTEYLHGGNLEEFWQINHKGVFPLEMLMEILTQVTRGVSIAHSSNPAIIHRDIKLQNILIGFDGEKLRAVLCDFGLAKHVNSLTLLATAMGTLPFKPPEVFGDQHQESTASDVWGIGCCFYLLLTGHFPYHVLEALNIKFFPTFKEEFIPASHFNVDVDEALDKIIQASLEKDVKKRIPNANALLEELDSWRPDYHAKNHNLVNAHFVDLPAQSKTPGDLELMITQAEALARFPGKLHLAAEILESVITRNHLLAEKYTKKLNLWRKGLAG